MEVHNTKAEPWRITLVETGENTMTGGRLKRVKEYVGNESFCLTYGDGVSDVNISELIKFHKTQNVQATLTAVQQPGRFGAFTLGPADVRVGNFKEKPLTGDTPWINGGFFVCEPSVFDLIADDSTTWEREPLENLASSGNLAAYKHTGFWQAMDTLRDRHYLEDLWKSGKAPWKIWK